MRLIYQLWILVLTVAISQTTFAESIIINGEKKINQPISYKNVTIDLTKGRFTVDMDATLDIENSTINVVISPDNSWAINLISGNLIFKNNIVNVTTESIQPNPTESAQYHVLNIIQGSVNIQKNRFSIDKPYSTGLFITSPKSTHNFIIKNNEIYNFHGGFYLTNSNYATIDKNLFKNVSYANILFKNSHNNIASNNTILFSGNENVGDSIDLIESNHITLNKNYIISSSCYSLFILNCQDVLIENNSVISGITYAIYINSAISPNNIYQSHLINVVSKNNFNNDTQQNKNISIINNYIAQNRFGLTATNVDGLTVKNNIFIQKFIDGKTRQFWTNNNILLKNTINLTWEKNLYKESFSQEISGDNNKSFKFAIFPLNNGVLL